MTKFRTDCTVRRFQVQCRTLPVEGTEREEQWVEGYATRFNSPTVLFEMDGVEYREQICAGAFDSAKMDDVIMNYNHGGKVVARTRNKTLQLQVDHDGLFIRARLDGTEEGRALYAEIAGGYIDRMSFQFTVREESYDAQNHQFNVRGIKRLYDVSAVDIPAYEDTYIEARKAEALEVDAQSRKHAADAALARGKLGLLLRL
jgi:HK97 family phage prohead protease